jgi:myo-inositol-1(or 4)-monophosphatase
LYFEGKPLLGVVYNPIMKEFFFAQKDGGAFLNDQPIHVSKKQEFEKACLVTGFPYKFPDSRRHPVDVFAKIVKLGLPVRRLGSAALDLCWVACGRFDGFWEYNLQPWDVAAGYLIVSEAGGQISNFSAKSIDAFEKETLATNGLIHEALRNMIIEG